MGYYRQTSVDPTFDDFVRLTGVLSSRWLREHATQMSVAAAVAATGGIARGGARQRFGAAGLEAKSAVASAHAHHAPSLRRAIGLAIDYDSDRLFIMHLRDAQNPDTSRGYFSVWDVSDPVADFGLGDPLE